MADIAPGGHDLFEIMRTTRSMRRLKPDPIPAALLKQVLEAGTFAALERDEINARELYLLLEGLEVVRERRRYTRLPING